MARAHKYGAVPVVIDGIRFASTKEGRRYSELKLLEKAGEIHALALQPRFQLAAWNLDHAKAPVIGEYRGDFQYCACPGGAQCDLSMLIVEDVKGMDTPLSKWKRKHVAAQCGIEVRIV